MNPECAIVMGRADEYVNNELTLGVKLSDAKHIAGCLACRLVIDAGREAPREPLIKFSLFREPPTADDLSFTVPHDYFLGTFTSLKGAQDAAYDMLNARYKDSELFASVPTEWSHPETNVWLCKATFVYHSGKTPKWLLRSGKLADEAMPVFRVVEHRQDVPITDNYPKG